MAASYQKSALHSSIGVLAPAFFAAFEVFCRYHGYRRATTGRWNLAK
jgi:hypothetical protein